MRLGEGRPGVFHSLSARASVIMVVDHPNGLHQCVHRCRTDERPAPKFQILRELDRFRRRGLEQTVLRDNRSVRSKRPQIPTEGLLLVDEKPTGTSVRQNCLDLLAMSDDRRVCDKSIDVEVRQRTELIDGEVCEDFSQSLTAGKNRGP